MNPNPALGRVLVRDGKWAVPVEERPRGWEAMLPDHIADIGKMVTATVKDYLTVQQPPKNERVAQLSGKIGQLKSPEVAAPTLEEVIQETESRPPEPKCLCGRKLRHLGMCKELRAERGRERLAAMRRAFRRYVKDIEASARGFGAKPGHLYAAKVMFAGMWTRDIGELYRLTGVRQDIIAALKQRFDACPIWSDPHLVNLGIGDEVEESGDLGFWLNAMVGTGEIRMVEEGDTPKYCIAEARTPEPKAPEARHG